MKELTIKIPSLPENIRIVESFIDNANEQFKFNSDVYGNIMVAVTEGVNNAIVHGNLSDSSKNVELSLVIENDKVLFNITDEGKGFDHENLPDPTAPENLENVGGRGIFLMTHLADEVNFNENGNNIELTFNV